MKKLTALAQSQERIIRVKTEFLIGVKLEDQWIPIIEVLVSHGGVKSAQNKAEESCAKVNPHLRISFEQAGKLGLQTGEDGFAQIVQFEVALTVIDGTGTKG
jgi:hypothetical protein